MCAPSSRAGLLVLLAFVALFALAGPRSARAATPVAYAVDAALDLDAHTLRVDTRIEIDVAAGERSLALWLYADRLAETPAACDARTWRWLFPDDTDLAAVELVEVEVEGVRIDARLRPLDERSAGGSDLVLSLSDGPARTVRVHVTTTQRLPSRFGRLGRVGSVVSLAAPWYPLVLEHAATAEEAVARVDPEAPDDPAAPAWAFDATHDVRVRVTGGVALVGDALDAIGPEVAVHTRAAYVPALAAPRLHVARYAVRGVSVAFVSDRAEDTAPPRAGPGEAGLTGLDEIDRVGLVTGVLADALDTARWLSLPAPAQLVAVTLRSRTELAATAPGWITLSDRLFQVFPIDAVRDFHRRAVARAAFTALVASRSSAVEAPRDRGWAADLRGAVLVELDAARRAAHTARAEDLLSAFAFHPAVDQLLYAPQVAFEDALFATVDEPDRFRDDPTRARFPLARGRRLLENLRDLEGDEAVRRFAARLVHARRPARDALARVSRRAGARLGAWLAQPALGVNYRLGAVTSEPSAEGYAHRVEVVREGAARVEPVEVEVEDDAGNRAEAVWDGEGERGVLTLVTPGPRARVVLDPRMRLSESAAVAGSHPRADDATSHPYRVPIVNAFALDVLVSEANVTGLLDLALRRRYDLEHTLALRLSRTVARTSVRLRTLHGLGPKVHDNRRLGLLGAGLGVGYLQPGFAGSALGGWALELDVLGSLDTRAFLYDPREGYSLSGVVTLAATARDDGTWNLGARGVARGSATWPIGLRHALVLVGGAGFTAGPALDADLQSIGGRYGLRGFANDELLGAGALFAVLEHRVTALSDLALNALHLAWVRELQIVTWAGAGAVFDALDRARGLRRDVAVAVEAGAGLRVHYEYGGVQPGVLALDVGVPLSRFWDQAAAASRAPIGFYVSFDQYY